MFGHSKVSSTPAVNSVPDNTSGMNAPQRPLPSQRGVVQGFAPIKWLRLHLVDLLTMAIMGAVGLGVYRARTFILDLRPPGADYPTNCSPCTKQVFSCFSPRREHRLSGVCLPISERDPSNLVGGLNRVPCALRIFRYVPDPSEEPGRSLDHDHGAPKEFDYSGSLSGTCAEHVFVP